MNTRKILWLFAWLLCINLAYAQSPQLISYQAVARDLTGKVLSEKSISVQVEILQSSSTGTPVYTEIHDLTTTKTGTINLLIGGGNQVGDNAFESIDWSKSPYFLKLSLKQEKESDYTEVMNTQMVSVPYALYAEYAGKAGSVAEDTTSPVTNADFTIAPEDNQNECYYLYTALNGGTVQVSGSLITDDNSGEKYIMRSTAFGFNLIYLTGTDLELNGEIEGEEGVITERTSFYSESSDRGRYCNIRIKCKPKSLEDPSANIYSLNLIIKDKDGNEICRYPFNYQFIF